MRFIKVMRAIAEWEDDRTEFRYGATDCCRFAAHITKRITGEEIWPAWAVYDDAGSAALLVGSYGGLREIVSHALGEPVSPSLLKVGDPVLANLPKVGEIMGVYVPGSFVTVLDRGLCQFDITNKNYLVCGWRV